MREPLTPRRILFQFMWVVVLVVLIIAALVFRWNQWVYVSLAVLLLMQVSYAWRSYARYLYSGDIDVEFRDSGDHYALPETALSTRGLPTDRFVDRPPLHLPEKESRVRRRDPRRDDDRRNRV